VAHRQYVFTVPRLLRPLFARHRPGPGRTGAPGPKLGARRTAGEARDLNRHAPGRRFVH